MFNKNREAGIFLHITSLPSKYGIGTVGKKAYSFIRWMKKAGLKIWQILPLGPTSYGDSPYQSVSAMAVNYYLIDLDMLKDEGLLEEKDYKNVDFGKNPKRVNYEKLFNNRITVLKKAFSRFNKKDKDFVEFCKNEDYLDFGVFMTIKAMNNYNAWTEWPDEYKNYSPAVVEKVLSKYGNEVKFWQFTQFKFLEQWKALKDFANSNGIEIMGDIPLYIGGDSVELWKYPELFITDENHRPTLVAGCPPDCFTESGQLWGNPVYDWDYSKKTNYAWWNKRIYNTFNLVDILRIDHFRGLDRWYAIENGRPDAKIGEWKDGPKFDLFKDKTDLCIVAEDLGFIDEGVRILMRQTGYPGMKILEFAFDGHEDNEHKPTNTTPNYVVYTGTHDNMPLRQYIDDLNDHERWVFVEDIKKQCQSVNVPYTEEELSTSVGLTNKAVELAFASVANTAIIPLQDFLALGGDSRMNLPSTVSTANWSYRLKRGDTSLDLAKRIKNLVKTYHR
ncbi:MAG: 4-alpha-glucanotransferase [Bacilli bacterium]